jgi:hypothetical protein
VNVLYAPTARDLRVLIANGDAVRIGSKQLVTLSVSVIAEDSPDARPGVGDSKVAENAEKLAASLWREPLGETPLSNRPVTV